MLARRWGTRLQTAATAPRARWTGSTPRRSGPGSRSNVPAARPPLAYERIAGGHSNLTYRVTDADGNEWALRRPPLGKTLSSAHDMAREHRVVAALGGTPVPVAPVAGLCEDESVNGAPFYVMEFVRGPVLRGVSEAEASFPDEGDRHEIGMRVADTLAAVHAVDPDAVGLGDLGRKEDYVARQLRRWNGQWEKSKTRELPAIDRVHEALSARIPAQVGASIVHGDYRLDNMILADSGEVAAVVDWELCTLGDPLADVGTLMAYWPERGQEGMRIGLPGESGAWLPDPRGAHRALRGGLRPRPRRTRLLHRSRLLEAGDHPRGRLRPLCRRRLRQGRVRGLRLRSLRSLGRAPRRDRGGDRGARLTPGAVARRGQSRIRSVRAR